MTGTAFLADDFRSTIGLNRTGRLVVREDLGLEPIATAQLNDRINDLISVLGGCERILRTPIYTPYTRYICPQLHTLTSGRSLSFADSMICTAAR